jgi:hypothetical protein
MIILRMHMAYFGQVQPFCNIPLTPPLCPFLEQCLVDFIVLSSYVYLYTYTHILIYAYIFVYSTLIFCTPSTISFPCPPLADRFQAVLFYIIIFLIIILGLDFAYKWKHAIIDFLSSAHLAEYEISSSIHFPANNIILFFFIGWIILPDVYTPHFLYLSIGCWAPGLILLFSLLWIVQWYTWVCGYPFWMVIYTPLDLSQE